MYELGFSPRKPVNNVACWWQATQVVNNICVIPMEPLLPTCSVAGTNRNESTDSGVQQMHGASRPLFLLLACASVRKLSRLLGCINSWPLRGSPKQVLQLQRRLVALERSLRRWVQRRKVVCHRRERAGPARQVVANVLARPNPPGIMWTKEPKQLCPSQSSLPNSGNFAK